MLTRRDKQREFQQRIQIAFDIVLDNFTNQLDTYTRKFDEILKTENRLSSSTFLYLQEENRLSSVRPIAFQLVDVADELKKVQQIVSVDRLMLYGEDKRLLVVYQRHEDQESIGGYVVSQTGNDTYLPMDDSSLQTRLASGQAISDIPLPSGVITQYEGDIPDTVSASLWSSGEQLGIRVTAPVYHVEQKIGVLVGEVFYTQDIIKRYASLSKTAINLFAEDRLSVGTLPAHTQLKPEMMEQSASCEDILTRNVALDVFSETFENQEYYQGRCVFRNDQNIIGAITVSLSQNIEQEEIRKIFTAVLTISGIVCSLAFGLSLIVSRKAVHSIQNIVKVIGSAAEGDLRPTAIAVTRDEIGMLARKLNQMIAQLRAISRRVQAAASAVNGTADTVLQQMDMLIRHMEQQSTSVENTTDSVEKVEQFIEMVARNTTDLLAAAAQILSAIQETRSSIHGVTASTTALTADLHRISSSVDQVNQTVKQISDHTAHLDDAAQQTEKEMHHIDHSLQNVSQHADRAQNLAKATMDAAVSGQTSVEASLQGMTDLKDVVAQTAQIIQKINSWGEQVSSILHIVDDITEQTSLLALNASIISAQAGDQGRSFAVVATEIKELAQRTKSSTKEIGTLIHELQVSTEEGVTKTTEGIQKADQGVHLVSTVKEALSTILDSATRASTTATDTAAVIQHTATSSQAIKSSMTRVTEMVSHIRTALQQQEGDVEQVVTAVENISGMAEQVNRASVEQRKAAEEIESSMENVTERFENISNQTAELKHSSQQIVMAMHTVESTTDQVLQDVTSLSSETVKNLLHESEVLQQIVSVFKVS
jgi:methyl-accepting chemotaxis protein